MRKRLACVLIGFKLEQEKLVLDLSKRAKEQLGEKILKTYIQNSINPKSDKVIVFLAKSRQDCGTLGAR